MAYEENPLLWCPCVERPRPFGWDDVVRKFEKVIVFNKKSKTITMPEKDFGQILWEMWLNGKED